MEAKRVEQRCNRQFYDVKNSDKRFKVLQGGTRSGKTYAICQYLVYRLINDTEPLTISIIRKTLPSLKASVLRDFLTVCDQVGLTFLADYNKTSSELRFKNHLVEFTGLDNPQKIRGRKRSIAFLNEANELFLEDFRQINMRTTDEVIIDFNPSDPVHWIYDEVMPRDDADSWISTYKDNKFLGKELVNEIERMKERDPDYWRVYGEGQRAFLSKRQIYNNWDFIPLATFPAYDEIILGVDFGFTNDETAVVECYVKGDDLYLHEVCYRKGMTARDIADFLIDKGYAQVLAYCDDARPEVIEELKRLGCWVKKAKKGKGSINAGISFIKEHKVYVSKESKNLEFEYRSYFWEEMRDGTIINKAVDKYNHLMDAIRYGVYTHYGGRSDFFVI